MPIHKVKGGFKWGGKGHVYPSRKGAERQAAAAYAHGYQGKAILADLSAVTKAFPPRPVREESISQTYHRKNAKTGDRKPAPTGAATYRGPKGGEYHFTHNVPGDKPWQTGSRVGLPHIDTMDPGVAGRLHDLPHTRAKSKAPFAERDRTSVFNPDLQDFYTGHHPQYEPDENRHLPAVGQSPLSTPDTERREGHRPSTQGLGHSLPKAILKALDTVAKADDPTRAQKETGSTGPERQHLPKLPNANRLDYHMLAAHLQAHHFGQVSPDATHEMLREVHGQHHRGAFPSVKMAVKHEHLKGHEENPGAGPVRTRKIDDAGLAGPAKHFLGDELTRVLRRPGGKANTPGIRDEAAENIRGLRQLGMHGMARQHRDEVHRQEFEYRPKPQPNPHQKPSYAGELTEETAPRWYQALAVQRTAHATKRSQQAGERTDKAVNAIDPPQHTHTRIVHDLMKLARSASA